MRHQRGVFVCAVTVSMILRLRMRSLLRFFHVSTLDHDGNFEESSFGVGGFDFNQGMVAAWWEIGNDGDVHDLLVWLVGFFFHYERIRVTA